jgi:hypothetical protein
VKNLTQMGRYHIHLLRRRVRRCWREPSLSLATKITITRHRPTCAQACYFWRGFSTEIEMLTNMTATASLLLMTGYNWCGRRTYDHSGVARPNGCC